jgi:hypothetical protein
MTVYQTRLEWVKQIKTQEINMARATADIIKEMLPLIDSTYTVRSKWRLAKTILPEASVKAWFESATAAQGAVSEVEAKAEILNKYTLPTIDPLTRVDIFETIMWPKISSYSPGWADHPDDKFPPLGSSMRGVLYQQLYQVEAAGPTGFSSEFQKIFGKEVGATLPGNSYLDQTTQIATDLKKLKTLCVELGNNFDFDLNGGDKVNNRKAVLNDLFSSENAVKLWFIDTVLLNESFANPYSMMGIDPFFSYLLAFTGWKGGTDAFANTQGKVSLGGQEAIRSLEDIVKTASNGQWSKSKGVNWYNVVKQSDGEASSQRAYLPNYATRFLECYAAWLQGVKSEKPEYYNDWYSKLVTDRFSLINMLVLINELVNVPGASNRFTYNEKTTEFLTALSEKYKTFEIEIGD